MKLVRELGMWPAAPAVIFCNTQRKVDFLTDQMTQRKFTVSAMHGDMERKERDAVMREFRCGYSQALITTGAFARRAAECKASLVINYDLPNGKVCPTKVCFAEKGRARDVAHQVEHLHRLRGLCEGELKGVAINFVTEEDKRGNNN